MALPKPFMPAKLICGIIAGSERVFEIAREHLVDHFGPTDLESSLFPFDQTDYYEKQMGPGLRRKFLSFENLINPEALSDIKLKTNALEEDITREAGRSLRAVNLDPGYLTPSALIMATAKDFAHRIPLRNGIYAHLEYLFSKKEVRMLDWTYPDYRSEGYRAFFLEVRRVYLSQLREKKTD